jgi:hypothetical protein
MKEKQTHHILPGESYSDYMKRHKAALQSQGKQQYSGRFLLLLFKGAAAGIPVVYAGYITAGKVCGHAAGFLTLCCTLLLAYVYFACIYYIKGYIVALRQKQQALWKLLWCICKSFSCLMAALAVHSLLQQYCLPETTIALKVLYWSIAALIGIAAAYSYNLTSSGAPKFVYWSYRQALKPFGQTA